MPTEDPAEPTRRQFHLTFIYSLSAAMAAMVSIPAFAYLFLPPRAHREEQWVDAADLTQLPLNNPQEVSYRTTKVDGWKVSSEKATAWVVKTADNQAIAFGPQCTHLGCAYHWDEGKKNFLCPCHTSSFAIDGRVLGGPAPRPLDRYAVKIDGNRLRIGPLQQQQG
jgi:menaquinol-cytochrome c reductase iron-sulfur subunit